MLLIAGHHGAGKTTCLCLLQQAGFLVFECSKIVKELYEEAKTKKDLWDWITETQSTYGDEYLSDRISEQIGQVLIQQQLTHTHLVAISGLRRISLKNNLKSFLHPNDQILLVWINVSEDTLYKRYHSRLISEGQQPVERRDFLELLRREEQYGLNIPQIKPDVYLDNNGTLEEFQVHVAEFISERVAQCPFGQRSE